jgi:hypothetical protein
MAWSRISCKPLVPFGDDEPIIFVWLLGGGGDKHRRGRTRPCLSTNGPSPPQKEPVRLGCFNVMLVLVPLHLLGGASREGYLMRQSTVVFPAGMLSQREEWLVLE